MTSPRIGYLGFGSCTPSRVLTNRDLENLVDTSDEWIRRRTGVGTRQILGEGEGVLQLALAAARRALEDAGVAPGEIGDIRVAVNTWLRFPSLATQVQKELGIHVGSASDVSAGCAGFIYAVEDACNKVRVEQILYGRTTKALVIGVDALSLVTNWKDRNTCVLFGDGAGAVVVGPSERREVCATHTDAEGRHGDLLYLDDVFEVKGKGVAPGSPPCEEPVAPPFLRMDGRKVFPIAVRTMIRNVEEVLKKYNERHPDQPIDHSDIDYVYPHQANVRIIQAVADSLEIPLEKVYTEEKAWQKLVALLEGKLQLTAETALRRLSAAPSTLQVAI